MKLLLDENLSPALVTVLSEIYPDTRSRSGFRPQIGSRSGSYGLTPPERAIRSYRKTRIFITEVFYTAIRRKSFGSASGIVLPGSSPNCFYKDAGRSRIFTILRDHLFWCSTNPKSAQSRCDGLFEAFLLRTAHAIRRTIDVNQISVPIRLTPDSQIFDSPTKNPVCTDVADQLGCLGISLHLEKDMRQNCSRSSSARPMLTVAHAARPRENPCREIESCVHPQSPLPA